MKYTVKFINESNSVLRLKPSVGAPKKRALANKLRQMIANQFSDRYDEETICHVLNKNEWLDASNVINRQRVFHNEEGAFDDYWIVAFDNAEEEKHKM